MNHNNKIEIQPQGSNFKPNEFLSNRLKKSISYWSDDLKRHLGSHNVDIKAIKELYFIWSFNKKKYMFAIDDRGKEYKIEISETI